MKKLTRYPVMSQLYCKVGDLAIVVNTELPQNLGQIVEVLGLPSGEDFRTRLPGHLWQVRAVSGRRTLSYRDNFSGTITKYSEGPAPDRCLRPVSGLTDDDSVEVGVGRKTPRSKSRPRAVVKPAALTA